LDEDVLLDLDSFLIEFIVKLTSGEAVLGKLPETIATTSPSLLSSSVARPCLLFGIPSLLIGGSGNL